MRIQITRTAFLLLGLLPLVASIGWATYQQVTLSTDYYREWIAGQTGMDVRLRRVVHAKPSVLHFESINLVDPEDGELIARCDEAIVRRGERGTSISVPHITVQPQRFARLLELLHDRILRQQRLVERPLLIVAEQVALPGTKTPWELADLRVDVRRTKTGPEAMVTFRANSHIDTELVRLHLIRDRSNFPATTQIELLTGDAAIPCELLWRVPAPHADWASEMTFRGDMHLASGPYGWSGKANGEIANLPLERLGPSVPNADDTETSRPSLITGRATIRLRDLQFRGNWVESCSGRVTADGGEIDANFMKSVAERLGLNRSGDATVPDATPSIPYEQLALDFICEPDSVILRGIAGRSDSGVLLRGSSGPLLVEPEHSFSPASFASKMLGLSPGQVPVSVAHHPWLRLLPLPVSSTH